MPQGAIVYSWGPSVRGREQKSVEVFEESVAFFDDLVKNNRITGHYPYFSNARDGGMWILQGEMEQLGMISMDEELQRLTLRVGQIVEGFTTEWYTGGSAADLADAVRMYREVTAEFA